MSEHTAKDECSPADLDTSGAKPDGADAQASDQQADAVDAALKQILCDVLNLDADDVADFTEDSGLFGHLPELDSMAVAGLLTEMEDRLDIIIEDEDVDGEMLETYGGLLDFARDKVSEG